MCVWLGEWARGWVVSSPPTQLNSSPGKNRPQGKHCHAVRPWLGSTGKLLIKIKQQYCTQFAEGKPRHRALNLFTGLTLKRF